MKNDNVRSAFSPGIGTSMSKHKHKQKRNHNRIRRTNKHILYMLFPPGLGISTRKQHCSFGFLIVHILVLMLSENQHLLIPMKCYLITELFNSWHAYSYIG